MKFANANAQKGVVVEGVVGGEVVVAEEDSMMIGLAEGAIVDGAVVVEG